MELVGELVAEQIPPGVRAVGGLTMGADPIAAAVASYSTRHGRALDAFSVRREAKKHGLAKYIEGFVEAGSQIAIVDDVVTTGGSTIDAIRRCRQEGLQLRAVIVLVDRQEDDGLEAIRREAGADVLVHAIFTRDELRAHGDHANKHPSGSRSATA
jgi:orotate phosphoribosyltransferase